MTKRFGFAAVGALLLGAAAVTPVIASSHGGGDDMKKKAVAYRQGVFMAVGWHFKPLVAMAKGEKDYDAKVAAMRAEAVAALAKIALEGFVEGTAMGTDGLHTESKADIWAKWDMFKGGMETFATEAATLAEVAGDGRAALGKQIQAVGKTCKGCHDNFREKH